MGTFIPVEFLQQTLTLDSVKLLRVPELKALARHLEIPAVSGDKKLQILHKVLEKLVQLGKLESLEQTDLTQLQGDDSDADDNTDTVTMMNQGVTETDQFGDASAQRQHEIYMAQLAIQKADSERQKADSDREREIELANIRLEERKIQNEERKLQIALDREHSERKERLDRERSERKEKLDRERIESKERLEREARAHAINLAQLSSISEKEKLELEAKKTSEKTLSSRRSVKYTGGI